MDKITFVMDSRMKRFVEGSILDNVVMIRLKDIGESFSFSDKAEAQSFITTQCSERFGVESLKDGYFDYIEEYANTYEIHRYHIEQLKRGKIVEYREEVLTTMK